MWFIKKKVHFDCLVLKFSYMEWHFDASPMHHQTHDTDDIQGQMIIEMPIANLRSMSEPQ